MTKDVQTCHGRVRMLSAHLCRCGCNLE